jgi:hypothetical protein
MNEIVNRVANSPIVTIDLEEFYSPLVRYQFDIKDYLFQGLVLRETEFRVALREFEWIKFENGCVAVFCSADAIVPNWAFMLVGTYLGKLGIEYVVGDMNALEQYLFEKAFTKIDIESYRNRPVVVKGCSKVPVPLFAYGRILSLLQPVAKSIMYGEPCSTVPLYKVGK